MVTILRYTASRFATKFVNVLITWLRNGQPLELSREEIRHFIPSFSQFGEDRLVKELLVGKGVTKGIYVDVGAFHPVLFSNTLLLWKAGFRGVNIDMNPEKVKRFRDLRPDDWNVCAAVSDASHPYERSEINQATECITLGGAGERAQRTVTLDSILEASPFREQPIDYLNIDCEGQDFAVLVSLNIDAYRPKVITIEAPSESTDVKVRDHLVRAGYELLAIAGLTRVFVRTVG